LVLLKNIRNSIRIHFWHIRSLKHTRLSIRKLWLSSIEKQIESILRISLLLWPWIPYSIVVCVKEHSYLNQVCLLECQVKPEPLIFSILNMWKKRILFCIVVVKQFRKMEIFVLRLFTVHLRGGCEANYFAARSTAQAQALQAGHPTKLYFFIFPRTFPNGESAIEVSRHSLLTCP
jgi:hypothetical protein